MKILVPLHGFVAWNGGLDLVRLIASALSAVAAERDVQLHFAMPMSSASQRTLQMAVRCWRGLMTGRHSLTEGSPSRLFRVANEVAAGFPVHACANSAQGILRIASEIDSQAIFPSMLPLGNIPRKRIGYIFDFQHRHLPYLFSARTRRNRERRFAELAADADGIVVNSRTTAMEVHEFLGVRTSSILAMPFAPYAKPEWFDLSIKDAVQKYAIRGPYLMVCNHFWKHKDHATALRAFALLREDTAHRDLQLVLTGDPVDHRDPLHYRRLMGLVRDLGIASCTSFLGLIPKRDQLALLRGAEALLQPTLFEGGPGGGSVYEAIGLGIPAVVSDIPVNREIEGGEVRFFRAGDPASLAEQTAALLGSSPMRPTRAQLLVNGGNNLRQLGIAIVDFLDRIAEKSEGNR